jgi:hypothetical protein
VSSQQGQTSGEGVNPVPMRGPVPPETAPAGAPETAAARTPGTKRLQSAWTTSSDGRTTFRLMPPLVLWWVWVAFVVFNVVDLAIQSHNWFAIQVTVALLAITGFMYACALRPKVISDARGLTIRNPFRDHEVPWGGVTGVFVGDSVEIQCARPAPRPEKTVYSWALYSPRRSRARSELRTGLGSRRERDRHDDRARRRGQVPDASPFSNRMSAEAREMATSHPSHVMARELARRNDEARISGLPAGVLTGRWAWLPIAAVIVPIIAFIAVIVAR